MNKRTFFIGLSLVLLLIFGAFFLLNRPQQVIGEGNAHLISLPVTIKEVRSESLIVTLKEAAFGNDDFLPRLGDDIYLFIPEKQLQKEILPNCSEKQKITLTIYDSSSIHFNGGLFTSIITFKEQIMEPVESYKK